MSHATIEKVESFLRVPSVEAYNSLRQLAQADEDYDPSAVFLLHLERILIAGEEPDVVLDELAELPWLYELCPRKHFVQARSYEQLSADAPMNASISRMQHCLRAIMASGNGSESSPFTTMFVPDVTDVLRVLGEEDPSNCKRLVHRGRRCCEVVTGRSGKRVYFNVTRMLAVSQRLRAESSATIRG